MGLKVTQKVGDTSYISCPDGSILTVSLERIRTSNAVILHITTPKNYGVDREEVFKRKQLEKAEATPCKNG